MMSRFTSGNVSDPPGEESRLLDGCAGWIAVVGSVCVRKLVLMHVKMSRLSRNPAHAEMVGVTGARACPDVQSRQGTSWLACEAV